MQTGVILKQRTPLDSRDRARTYHAVLCARCDHVIGRIPHGVEGIERDQRIHLAKVGHVRECKASEGAWLENGEDRFRRVARQRVEGKYACPGIYARVEKRGVAWRWVVTVGVGERNMDSGYKDTAKQAMDAADECIRMLIARGK